jgi:hypothetical protein
MHISHVLFHIPEMFIGSGLLDKRGFIRLHTFQAMIREKRVALPTRGFRDVVLCRDTAWTSSRVGEAQSAAWLFGSFLRKTSVQSTFAVNCIMMARVRMAPIVMTRPV